MEAVSAVDEFTTRYAADRRNFAPSKICASSASCDLVSVASVRVGVLSHSMSQGKTAVGVLLLGVTAAIGATAVYPLFVSAPERHVVPPGDRARGGFERKSMWKSADAQVKARRDAAR